MGNPLFNTDDFIINIKTHFLHPKFYFKPDGSFDPDRTFQGSKRNTQQWPSVWSSPTHFAEHVGSVASSLVIKFPNDPSRLQAWLSFFAAVIARFNQSPSQERWTCCIAYCITRLWRFVEDPAHELSWLSHFDADTWHLSSQLFEWPSLASYLKVARQSGSSSGGGKAQVFPNVNPLPIAPRSSSTGGSSSPNAGNMRQSPFTQMKPDFRFYCNQCGNKGYTARFCPNGCSATSSPPSTKKAKTEHSKN